MYQFLDSLIQIHKKKKLLHYLNEIDRKKFCCLKNTKAGNGPDTEPITSRIGGRGNDGGGQGQHGWRGARCFWPSAPISVHNYFRYGKKDA